MIATAVYTDGPLIAFGLTQLKRSPGWLVVWTWFLPAFIFMVWIFKDSRKHAYTYILPLLIITGLGLDAIVRWLSSRLPARSNLIAPATGLILLLGFSYVSYSLFVDHTPEYPWHPKRLFNMDVPGGNLVGIFGFPYSRDWREIGNWFDTLPDEDIPIITNEKERIASFYLSAPINDQHAESVRNIRGRDGAYLVLIEAPQSWVNEIWGWPLSRWHEKFEPLETFFNEEGQLMATVYFLTSEEIEREFR